MKITDLPFVSPTTPAQAQYHESIEAIANALAALKEHANGPAVTTGAEKQALLASSMSHMEQFVQAWMAFTVAGKELSAAELKEHRP